MVRLNEQIIRLIEGKNFAHLATVMVDGSPQVSPVWIDREGDMILVNTAKGRVKQRNVTRDPRVGISIYDQTNPYSRALIRGRVVAQIAQGAKEHIDKLAKKYTGAEKFDGQPGDERLILKIEPVAVTS